jgi:hypothetical protein
MSFQKNVVLGQVVGFEAGSWFCFERRCAGARVVTKSRDSFQGEGQGNSKADESLYVTGC